MSAAPPRRTCSAKKLHDDGASQRPKVQVGRDMTRQRATEAQVQPKFQLAAAPDLKNTPNSPQGWKGACPTCKTLYSAVPLQRAAPLVEPRPGTRALKADKDIRREHAPPRPAQHHRAIHGILLHVPASRLKSEEKDRIWTHSTPKLADSSNSGRSNLRHIPGPD